MPLSPQHRRELLALARQSIGSALAAGQRVPCPRPFPPGDLSAQRASFVTLHIGEELRGCCGTLDALHPLSEDVWRNAFASAFTDPRFAPLTADEWPHVTIHVSVLSELELLDAADEAALLSALRPQVDGLVLQCKGMRATFLPDVWEHMADPQRFLRHLKLKGGWTADFWSPEMRAWRYTTESFGD
jgi:AmmeMemoRadiSam system protein A